MSAAGIVSASLSEIRSSRLRTLLSALSVLVGVVSLTMIIAVGEIGRAAALASLERGTGRPATIAVSVSTPDWHPLQGRPIDQRMRDELRAHGAYATSLMASISATIEQGGSGHLTALTAVEPPLATVRRFRVVTGRWLTPSDADLVSPSIVVNRVLGREMSLGAMPAEAELAIDPGVAARIVGIVDDGAPTSNAYVHVDALERWSDTSTFVRLAWVPAESVPIMSKRLAEAASLAGAWAEVRRLDDPEALNTFVSVIQVVLGAMAVLALVSGGLGILNLGLVTVRYRAREFAIRRAFGATRRQIFMIVLLETASVVVTAGAIGVVLAFAATLVLGTLAATVVDPADLPPFPIVAAAIAFIVSVVLGTLAGLAPARAATRGEIIQAIRG